MRVRPHPTGRYQSPTCFRALRGLKNLTVVPVTELKRIIYVVLQRGGENPLLSFFIIESLIRRPVHRFPC